MTEEERIERNRRAIKVHAAVDALITRFEARMAPDSLRQLQELSQFGEWGMATDFLCAWLIRSRIPISLPDREAISDVLSHFKSSSAGPYQFICDIDGSIAALHVVEHPEDVSCAGPAGSEPTSQNSENSASTGWS